jgi:hypothetical protein
MFNFVNVTNTVATTAVQTSGFVAQAGTKIKLSPSVVSKLKLSTNNILVVRNAEDNSLWVTNPSKLNEDGTPNKLGREVNVTTGIFSNGSIHALLGGTNSEWNLSEETADVFGATYIKLVKVKDGAEVTANLLADAQEPTQEIIDTVEDLEEEFSNVGDDENVEENY